MLINVKVIPNAKQNSVKEKENFLELRVKAKAIAVKANAEVIKLLAEHFKVKKSQIRIVSGLKSRIKLVEITEN
ncbi:MAG: DUF167 domain-containing protein [Candidatus Diapherotrites archaeon]|nr:DUF167 domain-containing protein [Candidatus Diapherotrites archaeon]